MNIRAKRVIALLSAAVVIAMISIGCAKKPPQNEQAMIQDGIQAFKQGDYQKSLDIFTKVADANPNDPEAHFFRGNALSLLGRKQEAVVEYDKSIQLAPNVPEPYFNKGNACALLGKDQEALNAYNKAIEVSPNFAKAYYNKAMVLSHMGRTKDAQEAMAKARSIEAQAPQPGQPGQPLPPGHPTVLPGQRVQPPQGAAQGK